MDKNKPFSFENIAKTTPASFEQYMESLCDAELCAAIAEMEENKRNGAFHPPIRSDESIIYKIQTDCYQKTGLPVWTHVMENAILWEVAQRFYRNAPNYIKDYANDLRNNLKAKTKMKSEE